MHVHTRSKLREIRYLRSRVIQLKSQNQKKNTTYCGASPRTTAYLVARHQTLLKRRVPRHGFFTAPPFSVRRKSKIASDKNQIVRGACPYDALLPKRGPHDSDRREATRRFIQAQSGSIRCCLPAKSPLTPSAATIACSISCACFRRCITCAANNSRACCGSLPKLLKSGSAIS